MGTIFKRTARLFARPSFIGGIAQVLDMGATLNIYNCNDTGEEADREALFSDWAVIADEFLSAKREFLKDHPE